MTELRRTTAYPKSPRDEVLFASSGRCVIISIGDSTYSASIAAASDTQTVGQSIRYGTYHSKSDSLVASQRYRDYTVCLRDRFRLEISTSRCNDCQNTKCDRLRRRDGCPLSGVLLFAFVFFAFSILRRCLGNFGRLSRSEGLNDETCFLVSNCFDRLFLGDCLAGHAARTIATRRAAAGLRRQRSAQGTRRDDHLPSQ